MSSPVGIVRGELMLRGLTFEPGSIEETVFKIALGRHNTASYLTTLSIINAILHVGNVVASAVGGGQAPGSDAVKKTLDELRVTLFPEDIKDGEQKAQRVKDILEREAAGGALRVKTMDKPRHAKARKNSMR